MVISAELTEMGRHRGDVDVELAELALRGIVFKGQRHLRHPRRRDALVAFEDDVFHRVAAQMLRALLAEHPADRVDDVRLPAAVRPHDGRDAQGKSRTVFCAKDLKPTISSCLSRIPAPPPRRQSLSQPSHRSNANSGIKCVPQADGHQSGATQRRPFCHCLGLCHVRLLAASPARFYSSSSVFQ